MISFRERRYQGCINDFAMRYICNCTCNCLLYVLRLQVMLSEISGVHCQTKVNCTSNDNIIKSTNSNMNEQGRHIDIKLLNCSIKKLLQRCLPINKQRDGIQGIYQECHSKVVLLVNK